MKFTPLFCAAERVLGSGQSPVNCTPNPSSVWPMGKACCKRRLRKAAFAVGLILNTTTLLLTPILARTTAVLLTLGLFTLGLFTIGSIPTAGHAFPGPMHWTAHLAAYALIAFAFGLGWPKQSLVQIVAFVAAIGALIGVTIQQITKRAIAQ